MSMLLIVSSILRNICNRIWSFVVLKFRRRAIVDIRTEAGVVNR